MLVEPCWLVEVISFTPAMRPNCRSSGVATDDAIVSGLAPGSDALTEITGKSTWGREDTGELEIGQSAGQQQCDRQQGRRNRPRDERFADVAHPWLSATGSAVAAPGSLVSPRSRFSAACNRSNQR